MNQIEKFIPLKTKCSWIDDHSGNHLTGWVVIQPSFSDGNYTMSTKYKHPTWDKNDKAYFRKIKASKLTVEP